MSLYIQIGLSSLLPSSIIWGDSYMVMSSQMIALICWGLSLAELVARPDLFAILLSSPTSSGLFQGGSSEAFGYKESRLLAVCVLVAAVMCTGKWRRIDLCTEYMKETYNLTSGIMFIFPRIVSVRISYCSAPRKSIERPMSSGIWI